MIAHHLPNAVLRDRYRLVQLVGQGGMGCVYLAEDLRLPGRLCAVKEMRVEEEGESAETHQQIHDQFLREASILAQLDHPNLPKVSDFFMDNHREYLVMDYVPGDDLKQKLDHAVQQGELLPNELVLEWAKQLLDALNYLHTQIPPVLHRDIKPSNIKITPNNRLKLVDFGLVKLLAQDDLRTLTVMQGRGTALYTPLEQYGGDGGHTDVRSDVYALGATLYHLFTVKAPPDAKARFLNPRALRPLRELNPALSPQVESAILWAMAMHPDDRPNSIAALQGVFLDGKMSPQSQQAGRSSAEALSSWLTSWQKHTTLLIIVLILFLTALLLTIV